jgi:phenylacetate-CoA ligase
VVESVRTLRLLRSLRRGARRPPDRLARLQGRLLRDAVAHAAARVPFYRRVWDRPGPDVPLTALPVLDGAAVRAAVESGELLADGVDRALCPVFRSTGSEGPPLEVPRGPVEQRLWRAVALRTWFEHGYRWRHSTASLDAQAGPAHPLQRLGLSRTAWISPELPVEDQLRRLAAVAAEFVVGTPTVLRRLLRAAADAGRLPPRPRVVLVHGEVLDAATRELIHAALGTAPVELYGLTEVGLVAWQCERREGFHVNADAFVVEVLRDGRPAAAGELGSLVVTDLRGRTMPLIRYDTGDLAVAADAPCPCGRTLPLVASIEGRGREALSAADGRTITTRALVDHLSPVAFPDAYRVEGDGAAGFALRLAPGTEAAPLARRLETLLGAAPAIAPGRSAIPGAPMKSQPVAVTQSLPARSS